MLSVLRKRTVGYHCDVALLIENHQQDSEPVRFSAKMFLDNTLCKFHFYAAFTKENITEKMKVVK